MNQLLLQFLDLRKQKLRNNNWGNGRGVKQPHHDSWCLNCKNTCSRYEVICKSNKGLKLSRQRVFFLIILDGGAVLREAVQKRGKKIDKRMSGNWKRGWIRAYMMDARRKKTTGCEQEYCLLSLNLTNVLGIRDLCLLIQWTGHLFQFVILTEGLFVFAWYLALSDTGFKCNSLQ